MSAPETLEYSQLRAAVKAAFLAEVMASDLVQPHLLDGAAGCVASKAAAQIMKIMGQSNPRSQPLADQKEPCDLHLVERNLRNGNYMQHQLQPALLAAVARIRDLEKSLEEALAHLTMAVDVDRDVGTLDKEEADEEMEWIHEQEEILKRGLVLP